MKWEEIEKDVMGVLDLDKDGKVGEKDMNAMLGKTVEALTHNTSLNTGAFGAGFMLGFWKL